ncbi:RWD-domain-containing protein [Bimuria novae-zelandiae CBS 107.79]|uniref:RBR-type E3 ubiquitin transferase n=1 Tax=Bimuria novae-zelandiae CBS 107.79 TaxID=1447943 RepID=A0A6A5VR47_9PLEO|nr:RWD-domain-containing protein [Bimuria novae-zelandiae CBS 107.79]
MSESERMEELETLMAIYPELEITGYAACLDLPIALPSPLPIVCQERHQELLHLPALRIIFELPEGYPSSEPPVVKLQATWLSTETATELVTNAQELWEEYGGEGILFAYISKLQEAAEGKFGLDLLSVSKHIFNDLINYDRQAKRDEFQKSSYECSVCLYTKPGDQCYRMERCGHVFCVQCLQDCYVQVIKKGNIDDIKCMSLNCGTECMDFRARRAQRVRHISPRELLQIPIERSKVQRYVDLKRKNCLETDSTTVWCPRQRCQGAAKGNNCHKSTVPLEEMGVSDNEDDDAISYSLQKVSLHPKSTSKDNSEAPKIENDTPAEKPDYLAVCEDCEYAFCTNCRAGWHGTYNGCYGAPTERDLQKADQRAMKVAEQRRREEEQASLDYLATQTSPCPNCFTPVSKSQDCNHITCRQCRTHFCYLCSMQLSPENPYVHFNTEGTPCYEKLWVLKEGGDESKVSFEGIRGMENRARRYAAEAERLEGMGVRVRSRAMAEQAARVEAELERAREQRS